MTHRDRHATKAHRQRVHGWHDEYFACGADNGQQADDRQGIRLEH